MYLISLLAVLGIHNCREQTIWGLKRLLKFVSFVYLIGFLICLCVTLAGAQTQQRTFEDSMGRNTGRSVTDTRGNTTFYDNMGRNTGRSTTSNGITTLFYDNMGRQTGTIRSK
jgi:hypothetical protein